MRFCPKCKVETERYKSGRCKPCMTVLTKAYREANPGRDAEKSKAWREANPEKAKALCRAWQVANPEAIGARDARRRALKRASTGKHTAVDIKTLFTLQKGKCICCRVSIKDGYHVDHIYALTNNGSNDKHNLQLLCPTCNMRKHAKHPIDFMQSRGFLL